MKREGLENFIRNTGYVCSKCGKVFIDGKTHKNQEGICEDCLIAKLEEENRVLKRALESVCYGYVRPNVCGTDIWEEAEKCGGLEQYFIQQAKESEKDDAR